MTTTDQTIQDAIDRAIQNGMDTAGDPNSDLFYEVTESTLLGIADEEHIDLSKSDAARAWLSESLQARIYGNVKLVYSHIS